MSFAQKWRVKSFSKRVSQRGFLFLCCLFFAPSLSCAADRQFSLYRSVDGRKKLHFTIDYAYGSFLFVIFSI